MERLLRSIAWLSDTAGGHDGARILRIIGSFFR